MVVAQLLAKLLAKTQLCLIHQIFLPESMFCIWYAGMFLGIGEQGATSWMGTKEEEEKRREQWIFLSLLH